MSKLSYKIKIDGTELNSAANALLQEVVITDMAGIVGDTVRIVFSDASETLEIPRTGVKAEVLFGYGESLSLFGTYIIDEVSVSSRGTMTVSGKGFDSKSYRLKSVKSRKIEGKTIGDFFKKIAGENGLVPRISADVAKLSIQEVYQTSESDLAVLQRISRANGLTFKINGNYLAVTLIGSAKTASGKDIAPLEIRRTDVSDWEYKSQKRTVHASHNAKWVDYKFLKVGAASDSVENNEEKTQLPILHSSEDEAKRGAKAKQSASQHSEFNLTISMAGNPALSAESPISCVGFRKGLEGEWIIEQATHKFSKSGYKTSIECYKKGRK